MGERGPQKLKLMLSQDTSVVDMAVMVDMEVAMEDMDVDMEGDMDMVRGLLKPMLDTLEVMEVMEVMVATAVDMEDMVVTAMDMDMARGLLMLKLDMDMADMDVDMDMARGPLMLRLDTLEVMVDMVVMA